jgi:hypothetical protein
MNRKIIFLLLAACIFSFKIFAQSSSERILVEEYVKQSEKQKKTGLIMLGSGIGATILGTAMFGAGWGEESGFLLASGATLMLAGSISTLVSIPIIVSSATKAKKAAKLSLGIAKISSALPTGVVTQNYPSIHFSMPINLYR